ncbi:phage head-tail adaptor [Parageobacillus genomosp. 1]|uniref:Phage head-tail adaptor n=1 Tax=Parageobacillus genomosp. 1 TaxID=1295642 RepID=A0ABC9VAC0_9BACL|nr:phage head closure protein [Parageobacillus genomosp. 1]EZP75007.1 phage head-tail adaptor [Parageobacillus genomosp. 1]
MANYQYYAGQRTWRRSKISDFRHRLHFQEKKTVKDDEGNSVTQWNTVFTVWGSVEGLRGREYLAAGALSSEATYRIRIRYRKGVRPSMRILYEERVFEIESVIDINEEHKEIEIMCKEIHVNG